MENSQIEGYGLSPQQRRLWRIQDGSRGFRTWYAMNIRGPVDELALQQTIERLVSKHDILRVRFQKLVGMKMPIQVVAQETDVRWETIDWCELCVSEQEARLKEIFASESRAGDGDDLQPVVKATLVKLEDRKRVLIVSILSLCADGWGTDSLAKEIAMAGALKPASHEYPVDGASYFHFADWQNYLLESDEEEAKQGRAYWEQVLPGVSVELPQEIRAESPAPFSPELAEIEIGTEDVNRIRELAVEFRVNEHDILAACWAALMLRLSGNQELVIGDTQDGRKIEELHGAAGLYAKSIPVRVAIENAMPFSALLLKLSESAWEGGEFHTYYNSDVRIPRAQKPAEYHIGFEYLDARWSHTESDVTYTPLKQFTCHDRFKVKLSCFDLGEIIKADLHYDPLVYSRATSIDMAEWLTRTIRGVISNPEVAINRLYLISAADRQRQVVDFNNTGHSVPTKSLIHEQFEEQALAIPDALAAVFEDQFLTYGELNNRANRLAHHLQLMGVGPDQVVGLYLDRSLDLLVGILGILKAGGAYVPLDPTYPKKRLTTILQDLEPLAIVTSRQLATELCEDDSKIVCLDEDSGPPPIQEFPNIRQTLSPGNLVYVIYTSGSTGQPKGVAVEHRQLAHYVQGAIRRLDLPSRGSFAIVSTFAADLGHTVIYPSLILGGSLHIVSHERATDPAGLGDYFASRSIDCLKIVPSHFAALLVGSNPELLIPQERLILGGEASRTNWIGELRKFSPHCRIFNHYGPTETTVGVLTYSVGEEAHLESCPTLPLGRPIPNTTQYILDSEMQLLPLGATGELYIGGRSVSRGYLNKPEPTALRFVPDPFSSSSGARLYRTGDVARYLLDGNVEFLGRSDDQIKFNGYRVELNEIRTALNRHPLIRESMVVASDNQEGRAIIAYYVSRQELQIAELREFLCEFIIEETVPNLFVHLKKLPLTLNGKIDYRALPSLEEAKKHIKRGQILPRTEIERTIAAIWTELLELQQVGVKDNFFELGGHSLLATQIISRVRSRLQVEMPLKALFDGPTIAALAEAVERERSSKRRNGISPIRPIPRDRNLPLSFAQQRLWFMNQIDPESRAYNIPYAVKLQGHVDAPALIKSLQEIVRRHEVLRTRFQVQNGLPLQIIDQSGDADIRFIDLSHMDDAARKQEIKERVEQEIQGPFDLERAAVWRATLMRMGAEEYLLCACVHHIAIDGWSTDILGKEFSALYKAFLEGGSSPLTKPPVQYADFAVWQREWLQGKVLEEQLNYWRKQLAGGEVLELLTDRVRPKAIGQGGGNVSRELSEKLTQGLKELSRKEGTTLYMTLLAAFQLLLSRYTGQEDVAVGTPVANRNQAEVEGLVGFFVNTLVLKTDLSGNPSFRELLRRVRDVALGAYANQDLPFEKLVEELAPERHWGHTPLFQVMFVMQDKPAPGVELAGVRVIPVEEVEDAPKFDLTLKARETGSRLAISMEYRSDLFNEDTVQRMLDHYECLLEGLTERPEERISELPLLRREEQQLLLDDSSGAETSYPDYDAQCIMELFELQVERASDAVAVVYEEVSLTYEELNRRSNQLAGYLRQLGVNPDARVAICLERSIELVVALLATLKAGGAYVPLDPAYPPERLAYMLKDSAPMVLLTHDAAGTALTSELPEISVLNLERDAPQWADQSERNPERLDVGLEGRNLAYIIYTSGSTGKPKGAMNEHQALVNRLVWMQRTYGLGADDAVLQKTPFSFDVSVWEFFWPLLYGARLVMAKPEGHKDPAYLTRIIRQEKITTLHFVPSMLQVFLEHVETPQCCVLERVICSGEALQASLARHFYEQLPVTELHNLYGPTEAAVDVTAWNCREAGSGRGIPIGRPISNTRIYILDRNLQATPNGVAGEIYIGGVQVGRGYHGRPELTAERFAPSPFSQKAGGRMYRTGDISRLLVEGAIEFLGRNDFQVKIRGFRIELGEIESVLLQHGGVKQCAIRLMEDRNMEKRLVAYCVATNQPGPSGADLRCYLQNKLPYYMVPSIFRELESLPLTPSGKLDFKALPQPEDDRPEAPMKWPRTMIEEILCGVWEEVLGGKRIGVEDDFFELGGHSLLATQVVSRLRKALSVELPLRVLFESPTVRGLAREVERLRAQGERVMVPPVVRTQREAALPLSYAQQRLWFMEQLDPGSATYNIPAAVRLKGGLDIVALRRSINEIVRRHEVLRTVFPMVDGQPVQEIRAAEAQDLLLVDVSGFKESEREEEARRLAEREAARGFDLSESPLMRTVLVRLGEEDHLLLATMHHIVSDGWSVGILVREFAALYEAYRRGAESPLPELELQYGDFAVWQREWLQGEVLEEQLNFWRKQLAGVEDLELPTDYVRPKVAMREGRSETFELSEELTKGLEELSRREGVTLFMTLLAAFQILLSRYSGRTNVVVGTDVANRNRVETEGLIGFFVNHLIMRGDLSGNPRFQDFLQQLKTVSLEAYEHQDLPFERLVEELSPERGLNYMPLFQVHFTLKNEPIPELGLADMMCVEEQVNTYISKLDLRLVMSNSGQMLQGIFEYDSSLFTVTTINRFKNSLIKLLEHILTDSSTPILNLRLTAQSELDVATASFFSSLETMEG